MVSGSGGRNLPIPQVGNSPGDGGLRLEIALRRNGTSELAFDGNELHQRKASGWRHLWRTMGPVPGRGDRGHVACFVLHAETR